MFERILEEVKEIRRLTIELLLAKACSCVIINKCISRTKVGYVKTKDVENKISLFRSATAYVYISIIVRDYYKSIMDLSGDSR